MTVERKNNEVIIKLPATVDIQELQEVLNYARYKEISAGFSIPQHDVDKLADEINRDWWEKNKHRFVK